MIARLVQALFCDAKIVAAQRSLTLVGGACAFAALMSRAFVVSGLVLNAWSEGAAILRAHHQLSDHQMNVERFGLIAVLMLIFVGADASGETLIGAYEKAMSNDPALGIASSDVRIAEARVSTARSALGPKASGSLRVEESVRDGFGSKIHRSSDHAGLSVEQTVFDGVFNSELKRSRALHDAASLSLEQKKSDVTLNLADSYFDVLIQIESLDALRAAEAASLAQVAYNQQKVDVGLAPITDLHEAQARLASIRAEIQRGLVSQADSVHALFEITGHIADSVYGLDRGADAAHFTASANETVGVLPARIQALRAEVDAADAEVGKRRAGHMPSANIVGGLNVDRIASSQSSVGRRASVVVGVPIFSGGQVNSSVRQAVARRAIAGARLTSDERAVDRLVARAKADLIESKILLEARHSAVTSSRAAYEASLAGAEVGVRTALDVLENQRRLLDSELELTKARYGTLKNVLVLENTQGTLGRSTIERISELLVRRYSIP